MEHPVTTCDICGRAKAETNHWLVAIVKPGFEGIIFQPAEATEDPRNPEFVYEDICGQECGHKRLSRWLDELNAAFIQPEPSEGSEAA